MCSHDIFYLGLKMNFQPNLSKQTIAFQKPATDWGECGVFSVKHARQNRE
jgi:hypothetical protein